MTKHDSENQDEALPPETQPVSGQAEAEPSADSSASRLPEHTAETRENQEKAAQVARLDRRMRDVTALMEEKERYQLSYVYDDVPKPYYDRWKVEANELFSLMVTLHARRRRMLKSRS